MFKDWGGCVENGVPKLTCLPVVFQNLIAAALMFVGAVALFFIIYSGIKFINSGGDPKNVAAARQMMTFALLGVILVLSSFAIIYFISYATGTDCIQQIGFNC